MYLLSLCSFMYGCTCALLYATGISTAYEVHVEDHEVPGWGINVRRTTSEYIDPVQDTTIISGREICKDHRTEIVIVVESTPDGHKTRDAIRQSWANLTGPQVKVGFMIGFSKSVYVENALKTESTMYKDIIEESFVEDYYNLTLKGISILKWFVRTCPDARFLLKADDDTFVDVQSLVLRLASYRNSTGVLRGYLCSDFERDDRLWSKYYAPRYMYDHHKYPDFLQGSAYYMSADVAVKLFAAAMAVPIFHLEDVYITGLCAQKADVKPRKDRGVEYLFGFRFDYCVYARIITCNSVHRSKLQWVLSERNKRIDYGKLEKEYQSAPDTINTAHDPASLITENPLNYPKPIDPWAQPSANLSLKLSRPEKPHSADVSAATPPLYTKTQTVQYVTLFSMLLIFHWRPASYKIENKCISA